MVQTCLVIESRDVADAIRRARAALRGAADLVEIRLDRVRGLTGEKVARMGKALGRRAVATLRSRRQGGGWSGRRAALLEAAAGAGFGLVDLEVTTDAPHLASVREAARRSGAEVIASHHYLRPAPGRTVAAMLERCCRAGDIGKVAATAGSLAAAARLVGLGVGLPPGRRFVLVGMGDRGALTRALAVEMGCALQYVRPDEGAAAAPGQLSLGEWSGMRGARRGRGQVLGLVGRPVGHSVSRPMQNAALRAAGVPGIYVPLEARGVADLASLLATPGLRGCNVTMPHKERILPLLDALHPRARRLGAVNTVRLRGGEARGYNTDGHGFLRMLEATRLRRARRAVVVGAGGAARSVVDVLLDGVADELVIASRKVARARSLARWADRPCEATGIDGLVDAGPFDLVVHCTPVGTAGGPRGEVIPAALLREGVTVLDLVYNPLETPLIARARRRGARALGGLEMLVHQGARSFEIWTGRPAPVAAMRRAARDAVRAMGQRRPRGEA